MNFLDTWNISGYFYLYIFSCKRNDLEKRFSCTHLLICENCPMSNFAPVLLRNMAFVALALTGMQVVGIDYKKGCVRCDEYEIAFYQKII